MYLLIDSKGGLKAAPVLVAQMLQDADKNKGKVVDVKNHRVYSDGNWQEIEGVDNENS